MDKVNEDDSWKQILNQMKEVTGDVLANFSRVLDWKARLQGGVETFNMLLMTASILMLSPFPDEPIAMSYKK